VRLAGGEAAQDADLRAGAFSGKVVSARGGEAVPGASLTFEHEGAALTIASGADGAFALEPREPGIYALALVTAKGFHAFAPEWGQSPITLVAREGEIVRGITIALAPEVTYQGLVRNPSGAPAAGAVVRIVDAPSGEAGRQFVAGADGTFAFSAPDEALLEASHPDYAPGRARVDLRAHASGRVVIQLRPKGERAAGEEAIAGTVLDTRGEPAFGAIVAARYRLERAGPGSELHAGAQAATDERGAFALEGLDPGRYDVIATSEGGLVARAEKIPSGTRDLVLRLAAGGRIRGIVRDRRSGAPVPAFSILAALKRGPVEREIATAASFFDARGEYEIEGLPPGTYAVTAAALGYAASATQEVVVAAPPADPARADFELGRGGRLSGVVVEEGSNKPLEGARVTAEGILGSGSGAVPVVADATTDAAGRFALEGLAEGLRSVTAVAAGHHGRVLSGLAVSEGGDIGPVTIALAPVEPGEEPRMELTGIGAVLSAKGDALVIGQVMPGGGAAAAGLAPGDAIVAIDGDGVVDLGFEAAVQRIRGAEGSVVTLSVRKGGEGAPLDIAVPRTRVRG
jgi:hypothetical protein